MFLFGFHLYDNISRFCLVEPDFELHIEQNSNYKVYIFNLY